MNLPAFASWAAPAACLLMLAAAVWKDVGERRIPNAVVAAGLAAALAGALLPGGAGPGSALLGMATGLVVFLPLYALGAMGAGDVKLLAAVGAFAGYPGVLGVALFSLAAGGLVALAVALHHGIVRAVFTNLRTGVWFGLAQALGGHLPRADAMPVSRPRAPYAVAIALGTLAHLLWQAVHQGTLP